MKSAFVFGIIAAFLAFYLIFGHNGALTYKEMQIIQSRYEQQIKEMDEKIALLEREVSLLKKDNTYLEYVIRRELGLQKPDEDQYILPHEPVQSK